jgi:hypothetical protein
VPSFLCLANLFRSSRSFSNRAVVLSYNCPLNDRPCCSGCFCSVDSHLRWLAAVRRRVGAVAAAFVLVRADRRALDGAWARAGSDIFVLQTWRSVEEESCKLLELYSSLLASEEWKGNFPA